jgi:hypothetical protein
MLDRLNAHRAWANRLYLGWCLDWYPHPPGSPDADRSLPVAPAEGSPEEYCVKLLSHVIRTEFVWLARLRGEVPGPVIWDTLPPRELEVLSAQYDAAWLEVVESDLTRVLHYRRFNGDPCESTVGDIALHACLHGTYHRAQMAARAVRDGLPKPPVTDYIAFASGWLTA